MLVYVRIRCCFILLLNSATEHFTVDLTPRLEMILGVNDSNHVYIFGLNSITQICS